MPLATILLTSANATGISAAANLNWRGGKPVNVWVCANSTATVASFRLQYTLDDLQLVGGTSVALWAGVSSAIGQPAQDFNAATPGLDGTQFQFLSPIGAFRITSTTGISSGPLIMKVMQGEGW
jgi:hypothetical protein